MLYMVTESQTSSWKAWQTEKKRLSAPTFNCVKGKASQPVMTRGVNSFQITPDGLDLFVLILLKIAQSN